MSWLNRLKSGLTKTSSKIVSGIDDIFNKKRLDEETALELEDLLISADLGANLSQKIVQELSEKFRFNKNVEITEIKENLANIICNILTPATEKNINFSQKPKVLLFCGVNGNGKTTSIAKLAKHFQEMNKKILLAACDTFRAAAVEQLCIWGERLKLETIKGAENADPASVAFNAAQRAISDEFDVLMIDTAGRLHNKDNLMAEFAKIIRSIKKVRQDIEVEIILVLDATTGQNALIQYEKFSQVTPIDWLVITKLDGTAKAGIIISLAKKYATPILAIGVGETADDLKPFNAQDFANSLVGL